MSNPSQTVWGAGVTMTAWVVSPSFNGLISFVVSSNGSTAVVRIAVSGTERKGPNEEVH